MENIDWKKLQQMAEDVKDAQSKTEEVKDASMPEFKPIDEHLGDIEKMDNDVARLSQAVSFELRNVDEKTARIFKTLVRNYEHLSNEQMDEKSILYEKIFEQYEDIRREVNSQQ